MRKLTLTVGSALGVALTGSLVALTPQTGYAQALEEITVTARKTSESLQEVPMAITALGEDEINRLGIKDLNSVTQQDTSVQFDEGFTPSDTRITIRGLSPTRGRPNAATLVDGIDLTSEAVSNAGGSTLINPRLIDVQRIEIVKGPQSALYGRSAFAGAIQYVTKDPTDVLSGELNADFNSEDTKEVRGNVSIPISDTLGVLINGSAWDARGSFKNEATGDYVGDGDGLGGSITFKWEPTDTLSFKLRTEYSDDHFGVAPQVLLNDRNTLYDLGDSGGLAAGVSNLAPLSSNCGDGPLDNYGCGDGERLNLFFEGPAVDPNGQLKDLGLYDGSDPWVFNQYNKQVVSVYTGKIPDSDELNVKLMPNYSFGPGADNPAYAKDYDGVDKEVFRTSLVADWAYSDDLNFTSYTSYLDSTVYESLDIGKYFIDEGRPNPALLDPAILANYELLGLDILKYSPIDTTLPADGVHDGPIGFVQNSQTDTSQFSQEIRGAWQLTESMNLTSGLLYWHEDVEQISKNTVSIAQGPECWTLQFNGSPDNADAYDNSGNAFLGLDPYKDQCGTTALSIAPFLSDTYQGRLEQPDSAKRKTNHYSWYGSMDFDLTDKLSTRLEARFTREDNEVTGLVQNPCVDPTEDPVDGCQSGTTNAGDRPQGPSAVIICGQIGRCDRVGDPSQSTAFNPIATDGETSWWAWGYKPMPGNAKTLERTDRFWAPKATLEYFWTDDIMTYASWSRGIKPGGFSLLTSGAFGLDANLDDNFDDIEFDPERLDVWELGAKTTLFGGRVRLNASGYYQDFKDKQVTVQAVVGNTVGTKVENISGSEIWGFETDATWQIDDRWRTSLAWTYLNSEYTDYEILTTSGNDIARVQLGNGKGCTRLATPAEAPLEGCLASFNGNDLERVPRHALNAKVNYTNSFFDTGYDWYSEAGWRYQDARYMEAFNIVEFPSYHVTDLRLGLITDTWEITAFVDNLLDDDTVKTGGPNPGIPTASFGFGFSPNLGVGEFPGVNAGPKLPSDIYAQMAPPRTVGIRTTFRFGE